MSPTLQAFVIMTGLVIGVFAWLYYRIPKAMAEDIAAYTRMFEIAGISGEVAWNADGHAFAFDHKGRGYKLRLISAGSSYVGEDGYVDTSSSWTSLETAVESKGAFSLHRKKTAERLLQTLGLSKSGSSGDFRFDEHFTITSNDPDFASKYFSDPERRQTARSLFGQGCIGISLNEGVISLCWTPFNSAASIADGNLLRAGLDSVPTLIGNLNAS